MSATVSRVEQMEMSQQMDTDALAVNATFRFSLKPIQPGNAKDEGLCDDLPLASPQPAVVLNSPSLLFGLIGAALPELTAPAWKLCCVIAMRQLSVAAMGKDATHSTEPVALSIAELVEATGLARVTVISAIKVAVETGWLTQEKRRTPHGGNAVALYSINWRKAEQAERARRKQARE